jgi:hypothetical protein
MNKARIDTILWLSVMALGCGTGGENSGDDGGSTAPDVTSADDGDGPGATGGGPGVTADGTGANSTTSGAHGDDGPPPIWFDLGTIPDAPMFCQQGEGEVEASYIWIANSTQGTISKFNTQTLVEEGRYQTRPDTSGSPSRTSVSLTGNVAVANRSGGLAKFYANHDECDDNGNNNGVANTSTNSMWLPWGTDECLAWYTPMAYASQRPVAWTQGEFDTAACKTVNEKVWTSGANGSNIDVLLVDGDTGIIEDTIPIPGVAANFYGIYGAAVDSEGNFWGSQLGGGMLVNVNLQTLAVQTWPTPAGGYGMTVDSDGYVWTCAWEAGRFDPVTETWASASVNGGGGCMADSNGLLWLASNPLVGIDRATLAVVHSIPLPEYVHGVSIDFEGYVWGVSMNQAAYRVDPNTGLFDTVTGLVSPYTYSDMTGFALSNVGGGGAPSG